MKDKVKKKNRSGQVELSTIFVQGAMSRQVPKKKDDKLRNLELGETDLKDDVFSVAVTKYSDKCNLWEKGFLLAYSQFQRGKTWREKASCLDCIHTQDPRKNESMLLLSTLSPLCIIQDPRWQPSNGATYMGVSGSAHLTLT